MLFPENLLFPASFIKKKTCKSLTICSQAGISIVWRCHVLLPSMRFIMLATNHFTSNHPTSATSPTTFELVSLSARLTSIKSQQYQIQYSIVSDLAATPDNLNGLWSAKNLHWMIHFSNRELNQSSQVVQVDQLLFMVSDFTKSNYFLSNWPQKINSFSSLICQSAIQLSRIKFILQQDIFHQQVDKSTRHGVVKAQAQIN